MPLPIKRPELFDGFPVSEGMLVPTDRSLPPIPLKHTGVRASIIGPICAVEVEQQFHNTHTRPVEALYVFPLPEDAAVTELTLTLGNRVITGAVQERAEARREYENARAGGQGAALVEQERPNIFSVAVANIQPDEQVRVTIHFHDRLSFDDGRYEWVFPTVVLPRYTPRGEQAQAAPASPLMPADARDGHTLTMSIELDAGKLEQISSPSHEIDVEQGRGGRATIKMRQADSIPNKDFVLRYKPFVGSMPAAAAFTYRPENKPGTLLLNLTPPGDVSPEAILPRELLFVFDRSGSMGGDSIVQARNALRACLRALNEGDTFNIFPFDDRVERFAPSSQPFTQASIDQADAYIGSIDARGGTEILGALQVALNQPRDERLRVVVFLTDGAVSNEDGVLRELRRTLGEARVFAFGIGTAVNRFLLDKLAEVGRGSVEYVFPGEEIEDAVQRFQSRAAFPLLTDLQLDWGGARVTDAYPAPLPDLYAGQPLSVLARFHSAGMTKVTLRGRTSRGPYEQTLDVEWPTETPDRPPIWQALPQVWARARIDNLLSEARDNAQRTSPVRDEVLSLTLEYHLLSPYTSFVAIEERRDEHGQRKAAEPVQVPIHLPQGTRREAFENQRLRGFLPTAMMHYSIAPMSMPSPAAPATGRARPTASQPAVGRIFQRLSSGLREVFGDAPTASAPEAHATAAGASYIPPAVQSAIDAGSATPSVLTPSERAAAALRYLARTQSVNGSWGGSATATALALLAFLGQGYTDRSGSFRPQLTRAVTWLTSETTSPNMPAVVAWALAELAAATAAPVHIAARDVALATLAPSNNIEQAYAALAHRASGQDKARPVLTVAQSQSLIDERDALTTLLHALADTQSAESVAQQLAPLQSHRDSSSGAVVPRGTQEQNATTALFAATALGAFVWGDAVARLRGV